MIGNDKKNEILLALEIIKSECKAHETCFDCPFYKESEGGHCGIRENTPADWEINDDEKWKAFR